MENLIMNNEAEQVVEIKRPYATWDVGGQEYRLKLTTDTIEKLELKFGNKNLLSLVDEEIPSLTTLIALLHGGMQKYHHGIKLVDVKAIYDNYVDYGGNQLELLTNVILPMFEVSGFFPKGMSETVTTEVVNTEL